VAKHISLREFQQALAARLAEAGAETAPHARLGVQAGGRLWLIRLDDAGEVLPLPAVTPVPLTRQWFLGLANIRGNLACVVDFAGLMGESPTERSPGCRLVLVAERFGAHSGLLVARMMGLRNIHQLEAEEGGADRPWIRGAFRDPEGRRWYELDIGVLVAHGDFLQVGL
jgi:twitching motility protein PilI